MSGESLRPTPLEIAAGVVIGSRECAAVPPESSPPASPLEALEERALAALRRVPCLVAFSGGRDSSALLAVAARVARREGLPLPVPVTLRYPGHPDTDEARWQDLVVRRLAIRDWHRITIDGELDLLGPVAQRILTTHGLLWPHNVHALVPPLEAAAGGTLVVGFDGDGLLDSWHWTSLADALARRRRPRPRDLLLGAKALAPTALRRRRLERRLPLRSPWLRTSAEREVGKAWAAQEASEPLRFRRWVAWYRRRRYLAVAMDALERLAGDAGTRVMCPLIDRGFLDALAAFSPRTGPGDRTAAMRALFSGLLPDELLARPDKAEFSGPFWGPAAREFVRDWNGGGVPGEYVDEAALRRTWSEPMPPARTWLLVQSAWLEALVGREGDQPVGRTIDR